jgi:predicted  nucleic acid-binding Zn-ribbon protein
MESAHVLQTLSQSVQALSGVVQRLEEGQKELCNSQKRLCNSVNQQFGGLQQALDKKLSQLSDEQEVLRLDLDELNSRQEQVEDDITSLKNTVKQLTDALEAEKRKLNLVFWGINKKSDSTCEQLIQQTLRDKLHITSEILIEYAHWTGNAILVRFQSLKQRGLVLTQAKQLPPGSTLSIREDYSKETCQRKA